ncbi:hypothetical protein PHYBOEH_008613 [Phytophthora boehmeriae]|uniref:Bzip transcription factor n=1 Tax=Phytophthora boehmeriae TaxID=109152 RepID=A0A8T1W3Q2_9STRA|nr:hypothetical protein PHYBOEH_008613 [Phytophthora boehmeriae]
MLEPSRTVPATRSTVDSTALYYRERHRIHQARYRKKMLKKSTDLEEDVQKLREHVMWLQIECQLTSARASITYTPWNMAAQYFHVFRYGLKPTRPMSSMTLTQQKLDVNAQRDFLVRIMASDVSDANGTKCGVEALMEEWRLVSICFAGMETELKCLEEGPGDNVIATITTTTTITETTLRYAFPRLVDNPANASLAAKLLGRQLMVRGLVIFEWDNVNDRVVSVQYKADMLPALLGLLGNIEDVSRVFNNDFITPTESTDRLEPSFSRCA